MKTGELLEAIRTETVRDPLVATLFPNRVVVCREASEFEELQIPGIVLSEAGNVEDELFETARIQFSVFTRDTATETAGDRNRQIRGALRRLFHHDVDVMIGGLWMWAKYLETVPLDDPEIGVAAFAVLFEFGVYRAKITG